MTPIDWTFAGSWPYSPHWFETPEGRMHFVDEGSRRATPIILVHGNPSWGYLYRHFIPALVAAGHRVIVPDHLGFGRSDKPGTPHAYRIEQHARRLEALLDSLDLRNSTVVPHDWGGPIGLHWATQNPDRVRSLAILNTFIRRPTGRVAMPGTLRLCRTRGGGELLVKGLHAALHSRPVFIAWGEKDAVLGQSILDGWMEDFPRAQVLRIPDSGHFLQEDAHQTIVPALVDFLKRNPTTVP